MTDLDKMYSSRCPSTGDDCSAGVAVARPHALLMAEEVGVGGIPTELPSDDGDSTGALAGECASLTLVCASPRVDALPGTDGPPGGGFRCIPVLSNASKE